MKIFLDVGGNNGCSVKKFRQNYDKKSEYKIYSFEPNPIFYNCYSVFQNHSLIQKAAWIYDGNIEFFISKRQDSAGSSIYKDKIDPISQKSIIKDNKTIVECIDLSNWIVNTFTDQDYIVLKMDIEGAEYPILQKMIDMKSIHMIDEIFIEWHYTKIPSISKKQHEDIIKNIPTNIKILQWDGLSHA